MYCQDCQQPLESVQQVQIHRAREHRVQVEALTEAEFDALLDMQCQLPDPT